MYFKPKPPDNESAWQSMMTVPPVDYLRPVTDVHRLPVIYLVPCRCGCGTTPIHTRYTLS
jgi:hypothetical protein